jgi:acid phosphatase (class A)
MTSLLHFKSSARFLPLFLLLIAPLLPAKANPAELPAGSKKKEWNWLSQEDQARLLKSIPPAPKPGSAEDKSDLEGVLKMQTARTPADIAEAKYDEHFRLGMISNVLDPKFTEDHFPVAFALLKHVDQDEYLLNSTLKKKYQRPRPYQASPEVKPLFAVDGYSYPSGHASGSRTFALVLALFFPEKKSELLARSDAVGRSRIVAGVHYPSDVEEGKKLADALVSALQANDAFKQDLAAAQAEIAQKK